MPYLAFQKHPPNKIRRRLLTILSIQILPLLAAEFVFHAEEQEFMAKVERGEVEMGFWMMD